MASGSATTGRAYSQHQFTGDKRLCDVVMKGGITSGVVYPFAVTELATNYRFKNIGGTSAGAIAAGLAAAAEYARDSGGFVRMAAIPDEMSELLMTLFQPQPRLRPLFHMLLAVLGRRPFVVKIAALKWAILRGYPVTMLLGTLPAVAVVALGALTGWHWDTWVAAAALWIVGVVVALALRLRRALFVDLPTHGYGVCSGLREPGYRTPALTEWIADKLDQIAGNTAPLTFGDLAGGETEPRINLQIMTTNLTAGRPYRIPFESNIFMFKESEWRKVFPARIMEFIEKRTSEVEGAPGYRWLPRTPDLPVVVAVRMSLSFPALLTAVPLYARDFTRVDEAARGVPRRSWFSDGGICSNFPIHFFDSIWPAWPTFGITLEPFDSGSHKEQVFLPSEARQGALKNLSPVETLPAFANAIIDTMQNWHDNLQSALPGYRDRIVHIRLKDDEGGLNLDMPPSLVRALSEYGRTAGDRLVGGFDWNAHRWTRYVISMARLEETLDDMRKVYTTPAPFDRDLGQALADETVGESRYSQSKPWREAAKTRTESLMREAAAWSEPPSLRVKEIPKPEVDLRITPRV